MTEWVLVPREPTEEMLSDAFMAWLDEPDTGNSNAEYTAVYKAMLSAAPTPAPDMEVVREWEEFRDPYASSEKHKASLDWAHAKQISAGDRMAAALSAQAMRIARLEKLDADHISSRTIQNRVIGEECNKRRSAEANHAAANKMLNDQVEISERLDATVAAQARKIEELETACKAWEAQSLEDKRPDPTLAENAAEIAELRAEQARILDRATTAETQRDTAREALIEVGSSGVEFDDVRLGYVTIQLHRGTWNEAVALAKSSGGKTNG